MRDWEKRRLNDAFDEDDSLEDEIIGEFRDYVKTLYNGMKDLGAPISVIALEHAVFVEKLSEQYNVDFNDVNLALTSYIRGAVDSGYFKELIDKKKNLHKKSR